MTTHVAFFASGRADLWPMATVLAELVRRGGRATLLVPDELASALPERLRGPGIDTVALGPFASAATSSSSALTAAGARLMVEVGRELERLRPDLLTVLGDRFELLGVCAASMLAGVPIVHLHGGEITEGSLDDAVRHAVTKLAHLHLTAAEPYAARVRSLGEEPWRVHTTGEPTIDRLLLDADAVTVADLERRLGRPITRPFGLVTYHVPTLAPEAVGAEVDALVHGCEQLATVVVTHPGPDIGAHDVLRRIEAWASSREGVVVVDALGDCYPRALREADVVLGNSSSGIVEAPSFGVPVVNVGSRQRGRLRWAGVADVEGDPAAVEAAVRTALDPAYRQGLAGLSNPYGDGHAATRIVDLLLRPWEGLLQKRFVD